MRTLIITFLLFIAVDVWATGPEYDSSRRWVEEHNPTDNTPAAERVFVAYSNTYSVILRFRNGITLREVIDQTKFKGKKVGVIILRSNNKTTPVFDEAVAPSDRPTFKLLAHDMIWLTDVPSVRT